MDNLRGIIFMMLSMACFAIEDTFIKLLSIRLPATQILFSIGFGGAFITMVTLGTLIGLIPAERAVSIKPIEALREE